ncbi:Internalin-A_precursor [Hexamita inflata]|uniref:Internalin-A n=1 Tax=Hexamita inflata TaxID=28002 RepID=A0AA86U2F5_9EUKA|nr:Internalin-A precursor [Hexamita inflata]
MESCNLRHLSALKSLINLQTLNIYNNPNINISELQYVKNITHLNLADCNLVSIYVLRPLMNLEELNVKANNIVYLDADLNQMTKLEKLIAERNRIRDFSSLEKHPNYNIINENGSNQEDPSQAELYLANKFRKIELPNIQLKLIPHKALKTALKNYKQNINATISNARQSQLQFTANVVSLFPLLNQFGFE